MLFSGKALFPSAFILFSSYSHSLSIVNIDGFAAVEKTGFEVQ